MTWQLRPIAQYAGSCLPTRRSRKVIHVLLLLLLALESSLSQLIGRGQSLKAGQGGQLLLLPGGRQTGPRTNRARPATTTTTFTSACKGGCQPHGTCNEEIGRFVQQHHASAAPSHSQGQWIGPVDIAARAKARSGAGCDWMIPSAPRHRMNGGGCTCC